MTDKSLRARVVLSELDALGLTIDDLLAAAGRPRVASKTGPTLAEYVPTVAASYGARTRRTYNSYWSLLVEMLGDKTVGAVTVDDLQGVAEEAARRAQTRRLGSNGRASKESCVGAMRAVFTKATKAGIVSSNPALQVDKPRRLSNRRRALTPVELDEVWSAVTRTTPDPELDLLVLRFHLETGARRMGAINLRMRDIDESRQTVWLREKFGAEREQPISRSLLKALLAIAAARGAKCPDDIVLWVRRSATRFTPITDRTYDRIFTRAQTKVSWASRTPLTAHMLRHTAVTAVERTAGFAVAQAFAGHAPSSVTGTYTKADISEVAGAVAALTGEPHPLAAGR